MNPFNFTTPQSVQQALKQHTAVPDSAFVAGGTNLIDLMKEGVARPGQLVDINRLPLAAIEATAEGGLRLGALARNTYTAQHPLVRERYPLLRAAILAGASPQIRNMASNGGNLLQRTRCVYFYDLGVPCNKHTPGSGCPAVHGIARQHAILGASEHCIATHPSDMCVALAALQATVHVHSANGPRAIPFADFHRLPEDQPHIDTTLRAGELITAIELPPNAYARHSSYLKIRERASYAFALVSVAAALDLDADGRVRSARLALGGVAHKPWRSTAAEAVLVGRRPDAAAFAEAAGVALQGARAWGGPNPPGSPPGNSFKIVLAQRAVVRALQMAQQGITSNTGEDAARAGYPGPDAAAAEPDSPGPAVGAAGEQP